VRLALSDDPVDQTCGIQQRACLIEELLDVESDFKALVMKAGTGAGRFGRCGSRSTFCGELLQRNSPSAPSTE